MLLFSPYQLGQLKLTNRIVMAPLTRSRAIGNQPNELMATYYSQRAGAGVIISEGIAPSPNGLGYARIPGLFSNEQVEGWKRVTNAVHNEGGKIFAQLMHTGRMSHPVNVPAGSTIIAPSAISAGMEMRTDQGMQPLPVPEEMSLSDITQTQTEYIKAAMLAMEAGFDGVEIHGANGYLPEQFLSPYSNVRNDDYGGNIENRCRFVLELAEKVGQSIGFDRAGIRLSPYGVHGGMKYYPELDETYIHLSQGLESLGHLYIHLVDHSGLGAPEVPWRIKTAIRKQFSRILILSGGYTKDKAEKDLASGTADLIAFGKPFINNPDLVKRMENNWPLSDNLDPSTFYSSGEKGYTDWPTFN